MTSVLANEAPVVDSPRLDLFVVTLEWNTNNSDEGDYCVSVWAEDEDDAVRMVAEEMSHASDSGCETDEERARFVQNTIENHSQFAADRVAGTALVDIEKLIAGPQEKMSDEAKADLQAVRAIMKKYGVV